jgi:16S rRNA processing protein RimM
MEIGSIVGAQGLKGEVRVYPNSDFPERFQEKGERWMWGRGDVEPRSIQLQRGYLLMGKGLYVVKLAGIDDRTQAENLQGMMLVIPNTDRPPMAVGEYHVQDLLDVSVFHQQTGEQLGVVVDVFTTAHDILVVQSQSGEQSQEILIPFVEEIVPVVDLLARRIEVSPPPGLLELYLGNQN